MKVEIKMSEISNELSEKHYEDITPNSSGKVSPDPDRIKAIAFSKLEAEDGEKKERYGMSKITKRVLMVAAVLCVFTVTVAAFGGLDFFKSIFGDSVENARQNIQYPNLTAESDEFIMTAESILSDGYNTNIIVSLTEKNGTISKEFENDLHRLFDFYSTSEQDVSYSLSCEEMPAFREKDKIYYNFEMSSLSSQSDATIHIALNDSFSPLAIEVALDDSMALPLIEVGINQSDYADANYKPETVQLSPMGVLVIGSEETAKGGLPNPAVVLELMDGTQEVLMDEQSFDSGSDDEVITGGGGMVIGDGPNMPLVTSTMGQRNSEDKVVTKGGFSRILDLNSVKTLYVDEVSYPIN